MNREAIFIQREEECIRIDRWLAKRFSQFSRERWQEQIKNGLVTVNEKRVVSSRKLQIGDRVMAVCPEEIEINAPEPEDIAINVLYEDEWFAIVEKEAGIVVHPAFGHEKGTLVNALLSRFSDRLSDIGESHRPGIVHRLDKDTSGLLIVTLDNQAHTRIARAFRERDVERYYDAIVRGVPDTEKGVIDLPMGRAEVGRMKMEVRADGKPSQTRFEVIATDGKISHLKCQLLTGRTHQIRVHLAYIGNPVVGDTLYGRRIRENETPFQLLHASRIVFEHPMTGQRIDVKSVLPERFNSYLKRMS